MSDATGGSSVVRSDAPAPGDAFDVSTESGTLGLLRAIHLSALDVDTKNSLRDMLFNFRSQGGATVTKELADHFATYDFILTTGVVVESKEESAPEAAPQQEKATAPSTSRFGMTRQAPSFMPKSVAPSPAPAPAVQEKVSEPTTEVSAAPEETPAPAPAATPEKETQPEPVEESAPAPAPEVAATAAPAPALETTPQPAPTPEPAQAAEVAVAPEPAPVTEVAPAAQPEPAAEPAVEQSAPAPAQPDPQSPKEYGTPSPDPLKTPGPNPASAPGDGLSSPEAARIKEIKHEVNELVGNPVNLIDVHNEVGREYMNALLDAMKKTAGGSAGEVETAMKRLEAAFAAVKETMGVHARGGESEAAPVRKLESTVPKKNITQAPVAAESEPQSTPKEETVAPAPAAEKKEEKPESEESKASDQPPVGTTPLSSVAKEKQVQEMMVAQKREAATSDKQREAAEIASMDPLQTPEVTAGLNQLLSDWSLFKHSGIFGTGPSGPEHPLYKKLAKVPMAAIVAGRFDGVTPQIKRTISDTMNGWRYEEGIIHEQGEVFEVYLRRVIKHILEKRKLDSES